MHHVPQPPSSSQPVRNKEKGEEVDRGGTGRFLEEQQWEEKRREGKRRELETDPH